MRLHDDVLFVSPTDLSHFLACRHRTALELSVQHGVRTRPIWDDPLLEVLRKLGDEHEREYVSSLRGPKTSLVDLSEVRDIRDAVDQTLKAMRAGADVIVQAALARDRWYGRPDVLRKIARSSQLGAWSYEAADTKLARETRAGTILQLGLYCELLEHAQGVAPELFHVVTPLSEVSFRFDHYAAYFRQMKATFEAEAARGHEVLATENYPDPVDHCDICPWIGPCGDKRRADDHLSLVAGITRLQRRELDSREIRTVAGLGALATPIPFIPKRGSVETYERVRDQARLQVASRATSTPVHELIPQPSPAPPTPVGLARLPAPDPADVFLDLEGDPLAAEGGREYLFGAVTTGTNGEAHYKSWWANDAAAERRAFEAVVDLITERRAASPGMHVYHYAPYEPSAMKRLMGRYATREGEIDQLLRGHCFVDLYAVVRQGIRAGIERYSIKNLEPLYAFTRDVDLRDANRALRMMEQAIELGRLELATTDVRNVVEGYNRDDCVSTLRLRDWLEGQRDRLIASGTAIDRPPLVAGEATKELDDQAKRVAALRERLLAGVPEHLEDHSPEEAARYQLAYLLDWHRREDKAGWWEFYRLCELPEEDLFDEPQAVAGLTFVAEVGKEKKSVIHRYGYEPQEVEIHVGDTLKTQDEKAFGKLVALDREQRQLDIKVAGRRNERPTALFAHDHIGARVIENAVFALGKRVAEAGSVNALALSPERALLLRSTPVLRSGSFAPPPRGTGSAVPDYAVTAVANLDHSALAIQGPPGAGKTYTGARMILRLLDEGKKVGVTATGHKVIRNLLEAVLEQATKAGRSDVRLGHRCGEDGADYDTSPQPAIKVLGDNDDAHAALSSGAVNVLGGTAWLWARPEFARTVDVLFVDEAGQISLANVLGVSGAAGSLVLLGDPQQLEQPSKGSHPEGIGHSALQYILGRAPTMPEDRGLFLPITWRLAPPICEFTSTLFYDAQLSSKPGLERQALTGNGRFTGSGLWIVAVDHDGNRNASDEEAIEVARIVDALVAPGSKWTDEHGAERDMTVDDIVIVAPFNAHVSRLREHFESRRPGALRPRIGTVDKFQGQEAPVAIYSMATSRPEDAPRGMEFLYSLNRLNVATSRARSAAIVVLSPRLFEPDCRTPRQMKLANALCRFRELARRADKN